MKTAEANTKTKWVLDRAHSEIGFKIKHLVIANVRGTFKEFDGSIYTTGLDFMTAEIDFWLDPSSIDTGDKIRDEHLRSEDFFNVKHFREINFAGNTCEKTDRDHIYILYGDLTIKGVKKQVKMEIEFAGIARDPQGNQKAIFSINGKINRKDWGLNWNAALETGGVLVGEDVWISCELQLQKQP